MAGDNPIDHAILDDNSMGFVNRLLGIGTIKRPPPPPPTPPIDPTLVAQVQRPPAPSIAPPVAAPPTMGAVRPSPNDVPGAKPPSDPLAVPQPYQSRVLAPGGPAAEFLAYQKTINDQARKDAMFDQIGNSIRGIGASWSQNPAHVQALSAGGGAVPISTPAGPMSANDFLAFGDKTEKIRQNAVFENGLPAVAKSLGLTVEQARDLKENNPTAFGEALNKLTPAEIAAANRAERETKVHERQVGVQETAEKRAERELQEVKKPTVKVQEREVTVRESADQRAERILQEVSKPEVAIKERQQETAEQAEARALRRLNEYDLPELERQKLETRIRQQTEQRQRDELEQIQLAEEKRKQEAYTRGKGPMSEVEVAEAAQRLGRSPAAINAMTRAEVQAELAKAGEVPEEVRTSRAIEAERALHPVPPSLTDPDEIAAWKRANETPTEALIRRRKELEVESTVRAGPEATDFINKQSEAHASLRQLEQDAALRAKHSEALGQGIISGSAFAQVGLEGEKILKSIWPNMDLAKIEPTQAVAALAALRLQAKAKTSNLGAGQGFTGKDAEIVADAIGGNKVMTPEAVRRILTLEAQIDRFRQEQINEDIKQRRLANPNMASRSIVKPIGLEPINDDMRRFASNDALTAAVKSKDGYDNTAKTMGKTTTKELTDDMEKTIQAKLTKMNDKNKLRDVADTESFNTYKNMSLRGLERNRDKIVQGWTGPDNNLDDRDASLMTLMIEAKRAGKFGKIE